MIRPIHLLAVLVGLVFLAVLAVLVGGCTPAETKAVEADLGYSAQQAACVDRNATREAIDACRAKVRAAWAKDAGKDADGSD
jgi:hypothetical protein